MTRKKEINEDFKTVTRRALVSYAIESGYGEKAIRYVDLYISGFPRIDLNNMEGVYEGIRKKLDRKFVNNANPLDSQPRLIDF